ncbi:MAG: DNA polymerase I [Lachnospiraceae bacterium]|nr:DNA polymerase I [Lachnospiraceae bacterium]
MSEKILLIDGHSIMNRAYYGLPLLTNSSGLHTNALLGFINIMTKAIDEEKPDFLTVAFDESAPTFRHEMYEAYKGTRHAMPDELKEQIPVIKEVLSAMDIKIVSKPGIEADDIIGTISRIAMKSGIASVIISGDRDLLQLVTEDSVKLRLPHTSKGVTTVEDFYAQDVLNKYRVSPGGIIELKALMGDSSDNIPGVPKIGEKTATELVEKYGTIEELKEHIPEITKKSIRETLEQNFDMAVLSKKLATINTSAITEYDIEEARLKDIYNPGAYALFKKLEFKSLLKRFDDSIAEASEPEMDFKEISEAQDADEVFKEWEKSSRAGLCFDDSSLALSVDTGNYVIALKGKAPEYHLEDKINTAIQNCPGNTYITDLKGSLYVTGITGNKKLKDMRIMDYLLNPLNPDNSPVNNIKEQAVYGYSYGDDRYTSIKEKGMDKLLDDIEMPVAFVLFDMEREGIRADRDMLIKYSGELKGQIDSLKKQITDEAGEEFNINSPKQLGVILFEKLKLPGGKKTKTGYSTAADVLEKLASDHPIVSKILEYRALSKLKSTYTDALADFIDDTGRIHTTFNQTVTATGRLSSDNPNMQNIPIRSERGRELRRVFVPRDGYLFTDADYSQIELRILASLSGDEKLIKAYGMGNDIHAITASQVFHIPLEEVTSLQRRNAKAVNFGIVYGISSFGLSQGLSITRKEAQEYIERYFETYPGVKSYLDGLVESAKKTGYAETYFGRRRPIPELKDSNFMKRSFGERVAMNMPIQGTAADIMKIAMVNVYRAIKEEGLSSRLILQVHDELLVETASGEEEAVRNILRKEMMGAADLKVPLEVDINCGKDFYDAH